MGCIIRLWYRQSEDESVFIEDMYNADLFKLCRGNPTLPRLLSIYIRIYFIMGYGLSVFCIRFVLCEDMI